MVNFKNILATLFHLLGVYELQLVAEVLSPGLGPGIEGMGTGQLGGKNLPQK